jgi:hypothetical protein
MLGSLGLGLVLFPPYFCIDMCPHHQNNIGKSGLQRITATQQDYFLNNSTFASSLEDLQLSFETASKIYQFKIINNSPQESYAYAISQDQGLYSFVSAVFVVTDSLGEKSTTSIVCGLDQPTFTNQDLPLLQEQKPICSPYGSRELKNEDFLGKSQQKLWQWWQFWR